MRASTHASTQKQQKKSIRSEWATKLKKFKTIISIFRFCGNLLDCDHFEFCVFFTLYSFDFFGGAKQHIDTAEKKLRKNQKQRKWTQNGREENRIKFLMAKQSDVEWEFDDICIRQRIRLRPRACASESEHKCNERLDEKKKMENT